MTTRLWLIRHGEPSEEVRGRCYGSLDAGLSAEGRFQMEGVARRLREEAIEVLYSSPLRRAMESAAILSQSLAVECHRAEELTEIHFGDFEGLTYDEIAVRYPDVYRQWMESPTDVQFPNGESFHAMRTRVLRGFDEIRNAHCGESVAIVTHGGVNRIVIASILQMPDANLFRLAQDYAAINLLQWNGGYPALQLLNSPACEMRIAKDSCNFDQ